MKSALPWRHALLALAVVAVWGSNFVVIKQALAHVPPLLFAALRFALAFFPAVLFLPRPSTPWHRMAAYGLLIGVGQFGLLYIAINGHISPGLASLVAQCQVFFTIGLAMYLNGERLRGVQVLALLLATAGMATILVHTGGDTSLLGLVLVLAAALSWAGGNTVVRQDQPPHMLAYVVWSSAAAVPVLLVLSVVFEGGDAIRRGLAQADATTWAAVAWQAWGNTLFGYAAWGWLLARHPAALVAPVALLVPVFGMGASALWLNEPMPGWKLLAAALVLAGLALNTLGPPRAASG